MADGDAWRDDWSMEDALKHLQNDCDELTRCLQLGDEDLAALVATQLAKLRAPLTLRQQRQSHVHVSAHTDISSSLQATAHTDVSSSQQTGGRAVAAAAAVLKAAGRSSTSEATCSSHDSQTWKHAIGDRVEYFSQSAGGWIPACVRGIDSQRGTYILDIQPVALPIKVRSPLEQSTASASCSSNQPVGMRQHRNVDCNAMNTENEVVAYQRATSSTASEPAASVGSRHVIGEVVEYYSNTNKQWVRAVVQGFTESTGTYKLDVQPMALPEKVRKTSMSLVSKLLTPSANANTILESSGEIRSSNATLESVQEDIRTSKQSVQRQITIINAIDDKELRKEEWQKLLNKWNPDNNTERLDVCHPVYESLMKMWTFSQVGASDKACPVARIENKATNPFLPKHSGDSSTRSWADSNPFRIAASDVAKPMVDNGMVKQVEQDIPREVPARQSCRLCEVQCETDALLGPSCGHSFCHICLKAYLFKHDFVRKSVKCPCSSCQTEFVPMQIRYIIGNDEYDKHRNEVDMEAVHMVQKELEHEADLEAAEIARKHAFQCPLCLEEVARESSIELDCDHKFCAICFRNYLSSLISEAQVAQDELICPIPKCGTEITVAQIQGATVDTLIWNKFLQFRMNIWIPKSGDGIIVECPTQNCEKFLVDRHMEVVKCHSCNREFCPRCRKDSHKGSTCQAYERWEQDNTNADAHFEELMINEGWKPCPVCGAPSERDSGCNFMQCRSGECRKRTYWCYICGLQMRKEDHYTHFQKGPYEDQCKTPLSRRKVVARRRDTKREHGAVDYAWGWLSYAAGAAGFMNDPAK